MAAFTTIATGVGVAATAATTAASWAEKAKQNRLGAQARREAEIAAADAKKKLEVNFSDQLSINKEPYRMASEAINSSVAQAIEASRESERGVAATAGRSAMAATEGQMGIAGQMSQEMQKLDILSAQEDAANRNAAVNIDLQEARGSNQEAQNREQAAAQAGQNAWMGVADLGVQVAQALPLYQKSGEVKDLIKSAGGKDAQQNISELGTVGGIDYSQVSGMSKKDFDRFIYGLTPENMSYIKDAFAYKYGVGNLGQNVKKFAKKYNILQNDPYALLEPPL